MLATLLALAIVSQLGQPNVLGNDIRYARSGTQEEGDVTYVGSSIATPLECDGSATVARPCCYPFDSTVVIASDKPVTICWSMSSTVSLGAYASVLATVMTDANGKAANGPAACADVVAGQTVNMIPHLASLKDRAGSRYYQGICNSPTIDKVIKDGNLYPFCRITGDCTYGSMTSGTCDTTLTDSLSAFMAKNGCAYLMARSSAATTRITARLER